MKPHSARYAPIKAEVICRAALQRGPLIQQLCGTRIGWRFGRRIFNKVTVAKLIATGEAVRFGGVVERVGYGELRT